MKVKYSQRGRAAVGSLTDPQPIAIPAGVAPDRVANAVHQKFLHRGWAIAAEQPGRIEGTLSRKEHGVRVAIRCNAQQITIGYLSSENMDYSQSHMGRIFTANT